MRKNRLFSLLLAVLVLWGCKAAYYSAMEAVGNPKRDILVSRVKDARDAQEEAKEQFESALDRFMSVVNVPGGPLEEKYRRLNDDFKQSQARAQAVHDRIAAVEDVAGRLFSEWEDELGQYKNAELRRSSKRKLDETRRRYGQLIGAMKRAEKRMDPVLAAFHDQVLFLKHNLNAQAIASLKGEVASVEADVSSLVREMEAAIAEADSFLRTLAREEKTEGAGS